MGVGSGVIVHTTTHQKLWGMYSFTLIPLSGPSASTQLTGDTTVPTFTSQMHGGDYNSHIVSMDKYLMGKFVPQSIAIHDHYWEIYALLNKPKKQPKYKE